MAAKPFDYADLLRPDLPPAAVRWTGFPKYNFVGGHNDAGSVPVETWSRPRIRRSNAKAGPCPLTALRAARSVIARCANSSPANSLGMPALPARSTRS